MRYAVHVARVGERKMLAGICLENLDEREQREELVVNGRIRVKLVSRK
jgi:hypothetical protein